MARDEDSKLSLEEVLHRLVENSVAFTPQERVQAHEAITGDGGGDRHYMVPDPDNPDAGRNDPEAPEIDQRDQEIARLRAELRQERESRDQERADRDRAEQEHADAVSSPDLADSPAPANSPE